jgi:ferredoxin
MPFMIKAADCISCGVCEPACPNGGIRKDSNGSFYVIDADLCTECVGFFHMPQCAVVCPMDCCVLDPKNTLTEAVLFERSKVADRDSDRLTLTAQTSRFRVPAPTIEIGARSVPYPADLGELRASPSGSPP